MNPDEARRLAEETLNIASMSEERDYLEPLANALLETLKREDVYKDSLKKSAERRGEAETQWSQMRHRVEELEEALQELVEAAHWVLTSKGVSFDSIGALMKARDRGRAALAKGEEG